MRTQLPNQSTSTTTPSAPVSARLLQRKCACGNHTVAGGECAACAQKKSGLQRKLSIGASNDPLEHEADRIADQVMAVPSHPAVGGVAPRIQRYTGQATEGAGTAPASVDRVLTSSGRPLDPAFRQDMELRFGHDFSRVRVHSGGAAEQSARDVNAYAYTVGQDIVFGAGQYAPDSAPGRRVLAHELAHVVQQGGGLAEVTSAARLQRLSFSDVLEEGAKILSPAGPAVVRLYKQPIDDLVASVNEAPQHIGEFFTGELLEAIKAHWLRITLVTVGLIGAQLAVGALEAAPTGITQIIGALLEIAILAVIGYFAAVEVVGAVEEGMRWWSIGRKANGDPKEITEASKAFVRLVWHIFMAVLAIAGVRARIRAGALPRIAAPLRAAPPVEAPPVAAPPSAPPLRSVQGGKPGPIEMRGGRVISRPQAPRSVGTSGPVASSGEATARALQPQLEPEPIPSPVREVPPLPKEAEVPSAGKGVPRPKTPPAPFPYTPGIPGVGAKPDPDDAKKKKPQKAYPIIWPIALHYPTQSEFARVKSPDRDYTGENQITLKSKREREEGDPDFQSEKYHIHHVVPLFLGGRDELQSPSKGGNGIILPGRQHLSGHRQLQIQPQMEHPSAPLPPLDKDIYKHPIGTLYYLADFKAKGEEAKIGEE